MLNTKKLKYLNDNELIKQILIDHKHLIKQFTIIIIKAVCAAIRMREKLRINPRINFYK